MPRSPTHHWKVLVSLLYNRYAWITRHSGGSMTVPTRLFAEALSCRSSQLRDSLLRLEDLGLVDRLAWHGRWFVVSVRPPQGWARTVEASGD